MALLTETERAVLDALRLRGKRERGGLGVLELVTIIMHRNAPPHASAIMILEVLVKLEKRELVTSALIDGREQLERQRRLYYLTKTAMAP
jgi:hypothetical protein